MPAPRRTFTPEYKEEIAREVVEKSLPIAAKAKAIGVNEQTLRNWVNDYRRNHANDEPPLTVSERERLRQLEKRFGNCASKKSSWYDSRTS